MKQFNFLSKKFHVKQKMTLHRYACKFIAVRSSRTWVTKLNLSTFHVEQSSFT